MNIPSNTRSLARALTALILLAAGCRDLRLKDGSLPCSVNKHCPAPYVCRPDGLCWRQLAGDGGSDTDGNLPGDAYSNVDGSADSNGMHEDVVQVSPDSVDGKHDSGSVDLGNSADAAGAVEASAGDATNDSPSHADGGEPDGNGDGNNDGGRVLLTVILAGPLGAGSVLASTAGVGIDCGNVCAALVERGASIELVASPNSTSAFEIGRAHV
jgi:hypothetical protein